MHMLMCLCLKGSEYCPGLMFVHKKRLKSKLDWGSIQQFNKF